MSVVNDTQNLQQEDNLLVIETNHMHHECMDEVGEIRIRMFVSPLKDQDKSLVITQHIKGIAKMIRHMRARKEDFREWYGEK